MKATAIVLNYKRPQNIQHIADNILACDFVERLIISNNNPSLSINDYFESSDDRVKLLSPDVRKGCGYRWELLRQEDSDYFLAVDDDLFISPEQLVKLFQFLLDKPDQMHGAFGGECMIDEHLGGKVAKLYCKEQSREVDVLHQLYALNRSSLERYFEVQNILRLKNPELATYAETFSDDILISFSGLGKPLIHDLGKIEECDTARAPGIAACSDQSFDIRRDEIYRFLVDKFRKNPE